MRFNGSDYEHEIDSPRLSQQHVRIREYMLTRDWLTLSEIASALGYPEASISAQIRHLRKPRFGSWVVEKRSRGDRKSGLFEYRLMEKGHVSEYSSKARVSRALATLRLVYSKYPETRKFIKEEMGRK